jgi:hypothetical protein
MPLRDQMPADRWWRRIFEPAPDEWGLRGDPFAWDALVDHLGDRPRPGSVRELHAELRAAFEHVVGVDLDHLRDEPIRVEAFAHGGMSSGFVDLVAWRDRLMPMLQERGAAALGAAIRE